MKWFFLVIAAALLAASPFLTSRALGTKEAYNYNLSVADAVTQFRSGIVPVLAGQTEYAFNGRVHPLRTAPYLAYSAGLLDLLTLRQLGFWSLQNLVLSLSLIGGALACYWALRRSTPADPATAASLSGFYILSPSILAAAHGMDLYMTVLTVPFVPLIVASNIDAMTGRRSSSLGLLAITLAACWLAHPPIAFWMSVITVMLQTAALWRHPPGLREWPGIAGTLALFGILAGFGFASVLTLFPYQNVTRSHDVSLLLTETSRTFAATLRPVSARADQLGDFQLGYVGWALAASTLVFALIRRNPTALILWFVAAFLFALTAPVPGLHRWLWEHAPATALNLTNQWPMQRLYLPITMLVATGFALVWQRPKTQAIWLRDALRLGLVAAVLWTCWQSGRFISRGFAGRQSPEATVRGQLSGNIDLTPISYAMLGLPGDFVNGPMDPAFSFRLLAPYDAKEVGSNWVAPLPASPENLHGFTEATVGELPEVLDLSQRFTLQPGARYRINFRFLGAPANATLQIRGPSLFREYPLPTAGGPRGFGMLPGHNTRLSLWTSQAVPEEIQMRVVGPGITGGPWAGRPFAEFSFERVDPAALPVKLESLQPLRCRIVAADAGYLETPRMFIPGYEATVNGQAVRTQPSPEGLLMLPVPAGESLIEIRYPGPPVVRFTFWLALAGWTSVAGWGLLRSGPARWKNIPVNTLQLARARMAGISPRQWAGLLGVLIVLGGASLAWKHWADTRAAVGPIRIRFVLPRGETDRQQPLLVTGRPQAGTFIYAVYLDAEHIKLGVDIWGVLGYQTDPIKTDYFADQELVIDAGALYPPDHPALRGMSPESLAQLRNRLRLLLNGQVIFDREVTTHDSRPKEVTVGRNLIGGSSCEPNFAGKILSAERLPFAQR